MRKRKSGRKKEENHGLKEGRKLGMERDWDFLLRLLLLLSISISIPISKRKLVLRVERRKKEREGKRNPFLPPSSYSLLNVQ